MTKLKNLSDVELDSATLAAAKNERRALVVVLEHLAEVDLRKSFSPRFESLAAYAVGHLGYDSKSAWRRISALRLMNELPEIAPAIESGTLDLTKIVLAQNYFRNEARAARAPTVAEETISFFATDVAPTKATLTTAAKVEILTCMMTQTSREAERSLVLQSCGPDKLKRPDLVKPLAGQSNEVRLILTDEDLALVGELRGLLAHKLPNASFSEIVSAALNEAVSTIKNRKSGRGENSSVGQKRGAYRQTVEIKKRRAACDPMRVECGSSPDLVEKPEKDGAVPAVGAALPNSTVAPAENVALMKIAKAERTRCPGAALKRNVWNRAGGKCEICGSRFALEYDHRIPFAIGGKTTFGNLRLACRNCNQRESIKIFGPRLSNNVGLCPEVMSNNNHSGTAELLIGK